MTLRIRKSINPFRKIIFFESDEEFEDWAIAPLANITETEDSIKWEGDYSDAYKEAVEAGKWFAIKDSLSQVYESGRVSNYVQLPADFIKHAPVQVELPVKNLIDPVELEGMLEGLLRSCMEKSQESDFSQKE